MKCLLNERIARQRTESTRDTDDQALALQFFADGDFVPRAAFDQVNVGDCVATLDKGGCRGAEASD